jgi:hypothetical protein
MMRRGLRAFRRITASGNDRPKAAIMKARTVPSHLPV